MKWENTYLVFEVAKGSQLIVAGSQIVCFLKRRTDVEEPKVDKEEAKVAKLWASPSKE